MKNKTQIIWITIVVIMLVSVVLIFRNNAENNEINEETSVLVPSTSVAPTQATSTPSGTTSPAKKTYTLTDVAQHSNKSDCWLVIDNNVYNVTSFIGQHPGGDEILKGCGRDATSLFNRVRDHAENSASSLLPPIS